MFSFKFKKDLQVLFLFKVIKITQVLKPLDFPNKNKIIILG